MISGSVLPIIVFTPFIAAMLAFLVGRFTGLRTGWLMVLGAGTSFVLSLMAAFGTEALEPFWLHFEWIPGLDINLRFRGDTFGLFFSLLVSGIGTVVGVYSLNYIPKLPNARVGRYYAALIGFMGAMLGVALSDDLILLFVFWEITSITSFMLIGFWYEKEIARKGALTALQITGLGGLAMMVGFLIIGIEAGTFTLSYLVPGAEVPADILASLGGKTPYEAITQSALFVPALLCILAGAFTKSAQWPFHFWLPNAMVAPTPVSTYLHSATMVKAGIFLVGRMSPIFSDAEIWSPLLATVGLITFSYTAYQALYETDLKAILARTTLSTLGLVMFIYGIKEPSQDALQILNHAAYKGTLFLIVGIIEHATHTRDIRELSGLRHKMPITFIIGTIAALSMAGLPPFFGFVSKESLYGALLHSEVLQANPALQWFVIAICVISNAFIFAVSFKIILGVFCGKESDKAAHAHKAEKGLWIPAACLVSLAALLGLVALSTGGTQSLVNWFSSNTNSNHTAHVSLIPHELMPVILSLATISLGVLIYKKRSIIERAQNDLNTVTPSMQILWDKMLAGVTWGATTFANNWQRGSLRWYFSAILVFFIVVCTIALNRGDLTLEDIQVSTVNVPLYAIALVSLLCIACLSVVLAPSRLMAAVAITATGFLTSLVFVVYRSPDILLTQILIETVSTIFVLLILYYMPAFKKDLLTPIKKLANIGISVGVGLVMFVYALFATSNKFELPEFLGKEYLQRAVSGAGGENAVNVIIVDFRAIDTTGEIIVLVIVGMLIYSVLRARRKEQTLSTESVN
jgi:multicomponent Na+:H+ antiporter subunit A